MSTESLSLRRLYIISTQAIYNGLCYCFGAYFVEVISHLSTDLWETRSRTQEDRLP